MSYIHRFGGNWTNQKLMILHEYLKAYNIALKNQPFNRIYIDAFAGTGYITPSTAEEEYKNNSFLPYLGLEEKLYMEGSTRISLQVEPPFNQYIFIDKNTQHCNNLRKLKDEFPSKDIIIINQEANDCLMDLCYNKINWRKNRAVLFLDPYGMQVKWTTIEAIAKTRAIDLWYLFPLGIGVNRLLKRDGNISPAARSTLNNIFGATDWYEAFYQTRIEKTLFENYQITEKKADFNVIAEYIKRRLETLFPGRVAKNPRLLYNSKEIPLFLFCFAAARPGRASTVALKIAQHILKSKF